MASFTYWRINVTAIAGGASPSFCTAAEIAMASSVGGANLCTGGTGTASDTNGGANTADKAFDGSTATAWYGSGATSAKWIQYQFASAQDIKQIIWTPETSTGGRDRAPTAMTVQASNDGSTWTAMGTWNTGAWDANGTAKKFFPYAAGAGKRLWRFSVSANSDLTYAACCELQLHATVAGADIAAAAAHDAKTQSNGAYENAFDGNAGTVWTTDASGLPQWIQCQFSTDTYIAEILWKAGTSDFGRNPSTLLVQSSSDGGASFTTEWTETGIGAWTSGLTRTFTNPNPPGSSGGLVVAPGLKVGIRLGL